MSSMTTPAQQATSGAWARISAHHQKSSTNITGVAAGVMSGAKRPRFKFNDKL